MNETKRSGAFHFKQVSYTGLEPGRRIIILGAVHGNETCGTQAIRRVLAEIDDGLLPIRRGQVTFVPVTNPLAYAHARRMGDRNLNRNLSPAAAPADFEDHVANWLCPLLQQHEVLLDLHSFHTQGEPFAMLGPENNAGTLEPFARAAEEEALAVRLGVHRFVDGWLDTYARGVARRLRQSASAVDRLALDPRHGVGTTEYMRSVGGAALTLECGQHEDPFAPEVAYRAVRNTLAFFGVTGEPPPQPVTEAIETLRLYEVVDKYHAQDTLSRDWSSFDRVAAGELIGTRHDGTPVLADRDGFIVFPNPRSEPGQEWFYLAHAHARGRAQPPLY